MSQGPEPHEIIFKASAEKELADLPRKARERLTAKIVSLAADPRRPGVGKLQGREAYRIRAGDYRAIFEILDSISVVWIVKIAHRRDIYRDE